MNTIENTQGVLCSVHTETLVNLSSSPSRFLWRLFRCITGLIPICEHT